MSIDSTVFLCVSLERERLRERERREEREKDRKRGEREIERGREREGEKEKEREERRERTPRTCHRFAPSCSFIFFFARENKPLSRQWVVTVHWGDAALTCMRNGDYHGAIIEADLALRIACALPPPFLLWLVAYCTFSTPPWSRFEAS